MKVLHKLALFAALGAILAVDLIYKTVAMLTLAPGVLEAVGFVALGVVITGLIPAALAGRKHWLWALLVVLSVFLDLSFALESLRNKGQVLTATNDQELARIDKRIDQADQDEQSIQARYDKALAMDRSKTVLQSIADQLSEKQAELKTLQGDRKARSTALAAGNLKPEITGEDVFLAVPRALGFPNVPVSAIELIFFLILFVSVQGAVKSFLMTGNLEVSKVPEVKKVPEVVEVKKVPVLPETLEAQKPEPRKPVEAVRKPGTRESTFISLTWSYSRKSGSDRAMSKETFYNVCKSKGRTYPEEVYNRLRASCEAKGYIQGGKIIEHDQGKVLAWLTAQEGKHV